jgi:hypothetical protein
VIHIGFTGTRHGMTDAQRRGVDQAFCDAIGGDVHLRVVAHHGDCTGADAQFHIIAEQYGAMTVGHIPNEDKWRAFAQSDSTLEPLPYLQRNEAIVEESTHMIAAPAEMTEQQRGGTWATIRMARRAKKPLIIVYPDGSTEGSWG